MSAPTDARYGTIRYIDPMGRTDPGGRLDELREAVRDPASDYWQSGRRVAVLTRDGPPPLGDERMFLLAHPDAGIYLDYGCDVLGLFSSLAPPDAAQDGCVTVYPRHVPLTLPRRCFLPPALAVQAIDDFEVRPGLPRSVRWEDDLPVELGWTSTRP